MIIGMVGRADFKSLRAISSSCRGLLSRSSVHQAGMIVSAKKKMKDSIASPQIFPLKVGQ